MCIRDRAEFETYAKLVEDEMTRYHQIFAKYNAYEGVDNLYAVNQGAVSYTHLDVYTRQLLGEGNMQSGGMLELTPRSKKILESSILESRKLHHARFNPSLDRHISFFSKYLLLFHNHLQKLTYIHMLWM